MTEEEYILIEKERMNFLERLFGNSPVVYSTAILRSQMETKPFGEETEITPNWTKKIVPAIIFGLQSFMAMIFLLMIVQDILVPVVLLLSTLLGFMIFIVGRILIGKKYNYHITVNCQFLKIGKQQLEWNEISETLIQEINGRTISYDLVVLTKSDKIFRYSLLNFSIPNDKLSRIIEYYKKEAGIS